MIITAFGSATIISLLLLINAHYFDSLAVAQRTTPRSNETQSLDEDSTSATSNGQNLNSEVTNTPTGHQSNIFKTWVFRRRSDDWDSR